VERAEAAARGPTAATKHRQYPVVLGIDPGLTRCGVGAVRGPAERPELVLATCVTTPATWPLERRLLHLHQELQRIIEETDPVGVAVERVLFSANVRTAMPTGQAAGVALLAAAERDLPVVAYSPNEVKLTVTGDGRADKDAVARLVTAQLRLDAPPRPVDVTDALAVAITHLAYRRGPLTPEATTPARAALEEAAAEADRAARGGWEAVAAGRVSGRTSRVGPGSSRGDAA
jgi:crossover junction endodeoxyribonuclease RuvC